MAGKPMRTFWLSKCGLPPSLSVPFLLCSLTLIDLPVLSSPSLTANQQRPISGEEGVVVDLHLGSSFAAKLGLAEIDEWDDARTATTVSESSVDETSEAAQPTVGVEESAGEGKNKKKNKKKKRK